MLSGSTKTIAKERELAERALALFLTVPNLPWSVCYLAAAYERGVSHRRFERIMELVERGNRLPMAILMYDAETRDLVEVPALPRRGSRGSVPLTPKPIAELPIGPLSRQTQIEALAFIYLRDGEADSWQSAFEKASQVFEANVR